MTLPSERPQPLRKRASHVCQQCRLRKVKCNLAETGLPCQNCQIDGSECITPVSRRSRKYRLQKEQHHNLPTSQARLLPQTQNPAFDKPQASSTTTTYANVSLTTERRHTEKSLAPRVATISAPAQLSGSHTSLPLFVLPPRSNLPLNDLDVLSSQGALNTPQPPLRDALLMAFLLYVNPFLPVLDVQEFIDAIDGKSGTHVSLALFQAVMFAGAAFVDLQILIDAGFEDRKAARAQLFRKIKARKLFALKNFADCS